MKILLYSEGMNFIKRSGLGRAIKHQQRALELNGVEYTLDPKDSYDVVHINTVGVKSHHLAKTAKKAGKRVVYHAHATQEDFRNSFIFSNLLAGPFKKWICSCYSRGDVVISPSEYTKSLVKGYGIDKPIYAVSNGIDIAKYVPKPGDREAFRAKYGLGDDEKVVISVGLFFERKGLLDFVQMAKDMPDYKFIWFGETPLYSVPSKIRKAVKTKLDNLIFAGYVQPDELKKAYVGCDVYIFPTYEENEGIVLLEALAARSNVVVRDIPVFEWLKENEGCYKARTTAEFEDRIKGICEGTLPSLQENGHRAVENMDIKKVGEKLVRIYSGNTLSTD